MYYILYLFGEKSGGNVLGGNAPVEMPGGGGGEGVMSR